jgi:2-polyprenyl-3-methyl-5-hydroxy-6-metoxy-1,4-benzoquinol methylase
MASTNGTAASPHALTAQEILSQKAQLEQRYGKWTAHNIMLGDGIYTVSAPYDWAHHRAKWCGVVAEVLLRKPLRAMRVLDIGCLEGGITLALGEGGGPVVGIDIREANLAKANFARDVLGLHNVEFVQGDMLKLAEYELGQFDLIVCAGTLYHVDAPDLLPFLRSLRALCRGIVVFDTHVSMEQREEYVSPEGQRYYGRTFVETHHTSDDLEEKKKDAWGSLHNNLSFWPTERSLINLLIDAGYEFVTKPLIPVAEWPWQDRGFWVAYPRISGLLSQPYPYAPGRLTDPTQQMPNHPMMDQPLQRECNNSATRRLDV